MDTDNVMHQFDQIEEKVGNLIKRCKLLETKHVELVGKIKTLENELQKKVETENKYSEQKALIQSKIDGILAKLDSITET